VLAQGTPPQDTPRPGATAPTILRFNDLAHSSRTWRGARSPQGKKRVRQAARRNAILQPRRSAAKTLVKKAQLTATAGDAEQTQTALIEAVSALDRAAKVGAIHPNAAARRKSRLMLKINAALGGEATISTGKAARQTSKAQATKAAKARIAAGKASKAKGEQTAAGKARAALSKTSREASAEATPAEPKAAAATTATKATTTKPKTPTAKASTTKTSTAKASAPKTAAKATTAKPRASKAKSAEG
jgi:ribosomal protein S20